MLLLLLLLWLRDSWLSVRHPQHHLDWLWCGCSSRLCSCSHQLLPLCQP
jgi:hypothetical protein